MARTYEEHRVYVIEHGWTPISFRENGKKVHAWEHKETDRFCQDIEDAYHNEHYQQEVLNK